MSVPRGGLNLPGHLTAATSSNIFGPAPANNDVSDSATDRRAAGLRGACTRLHGARDPEAGQHVRPALPPLARQLAAPCPRLALTVPAPPSTFDRIVDGSRNAFVRFDKEYSYGDEHDAWKEFAKTVGESAADLLSCDVGVSGARQRSARTPEGHHYGGSRARAARWLRCGRGLPAQSTATRTTPISPRASA